MNPDCQQRLYEENERVLAELSAEASSNSENNEKTNSIDIFELVTLENLPRFTYLSAVINESLRMFPPAIVLERRAAKDIDLKTESGLRLSVRAEDIVQVPIYTLHFDEREFADPHRFDPTRFLNGCQKNHKVRDK